MDLFSENQPTFTIQPIGYARTPYRQKFGVPRQSGLVTSSWAKLQLNKTLGVDVLRGLEEFAYIWVIFLFHQTLHDNTQTLVRPPRLDGKTKKGIFATRSPHRPNHLGLSLLKLEKIDTTTLTIECSGADLVDGTPIIDIKPYLPHLESHASVSRGFSAGVNPFLKVVWLACSQVNGINPQLRHLIEESLAEDPRPAHLRCTRKYFVMSIENKDICFYCLGQTAYVVGVLEVN